MTDLFTLIEAAEIIGCSRATLRGWLREGIIVGHKESDGSKGRPAWKMPAQEVVKAELVQSLRSAGVTLKRARGLIESASLWIGAPQQIVFKTTKLPVTLILEGVSGTPEFTDPNLSFEEVRFDPLAQLRRVLKTKKEE